MGLYEFLKKYLGPVLNRQYGVVVEGKENIPDGRAILALNHTSSLDGPLICNVLDRKVSFIAKAMFRRTPIGYSLWMTGQILMNPRHKINYIHNIEKMLLYGKKDILAIFPEGARSYDGKINMKEVKRGVSYFSYVIKAPIVPVGIKGTYEVWPRTRLLPKLSGNVRIKFGKPIYFWNDKPFNKENSKNLTDLVMKRITELLE